MVRFMEYKRRDKVHLSVVENEDTKLELGMAFIFYPSLLCPNVEKTPIIPHFDFASQLTTNVADRAHDDIYLLHRAGHENSYSATTFLLLGRRIVFDEVHWGPALKIFGEFSFILKYLEWIEYILSCIEFQLRTFHLFNALYASLYTYDLDSDVIHTHL